MSSKKPLNSQMKKTVLITGATSGFGKHLSVDYVRAKYDVILHGRDEKKVEAVRNEILKNENIECSTIIANLNDTKSFYSISQFFDTKNIDILINNVSINDGEVETVFYTNTISTIKLCNIAFKHFISGSGGSIININSVAGLKGNEHEALYSASKFALRGFSESVKESWLKQGVKMIDIYPGAIATGMSSKRADFHNLIDPKELADFIVKLCQTNSFFVRELCVQRTKK